MKQTLFFGRVCARARSIEGGKYGEKVADPVHLRGETENLIPFSARIIKAANMLFPFPCRSPFSLPFSPSALPTSCPNAIKLLAARRANGEMSLTMVVIAGACRVSRFKSSFYLLHDRPGLNPIFVFIRTRFPGDRAIPRIPLSLSLSLLRSCEILRNSSIRRAQSMKRTISFLSTLRF